MQQERIHNNALVLSQLPVEREEVLDVLRELDETPIYMDLMMSPVVYSKKKEAIEKKLSARAGGSKIFTDFLLVMIRNHNEKLIPDILREYVKIEDEKAGLFVADFFYVKDDEIESGEQQAKVALDKIFPGKNFRFCVTKDESLIGGWLVRCNNIEIDRSYKGQLKQLEDKINGR